MIQRKINVGITAIFLENVRIDVIGPLKLNWYV